MSTILSIIVPVYKVENYLESCVYSIINQTLTNFELILVDQTVTSWVKRMIE